MIKFALQTGSMAKPFKAQIISQKLRVTDAAALEHLQRDADCLTRLAIRGFLPDAVVSRARKKLMDRISELVDKPND